MSDAGCTRSLACKGKKAHQLSHYRFNRSDPAFPAQRFTAYLVLSPATGLFCHRRLRIITRQLDASVGASGPHDFAVRPGIARLAMPKRPLRPAPNVRDDRDTPLLRARNIDENIMTRRRCQADF